MVEQIKQDKLLDKYKKAVKSIDFDYAAMKAIVEAASSNISPVEISIRLNDGTVMKITPLKRDEEKKSFRDKFNEYQSMS